MRCIDIMMCHELMMCHEQMMCRYNNDMRLPDIYCDIMISIRAFLHIYSDVGAVVGIQTYQVCFIFEGSFADRDVNYLVFCRERLELLGSFAESGLRC